MNKEMALPTLQLGSIGCALRPFCRGDEESLQRSISYPSVASAVTNIPTQYTYEDAVEWIGQCSHYVTKHSSRVDYAIDRGGDVIGSVAFIRLNHSSAESHEAQVSMWLSPQFRGNGITPVALKRLIEFGFTELGLVRIYGYTYHKNLSAQSVIKKAGMTKEGERKKKWRKVIDGVEYHIDSLEYAILNPAMTFNELPDDYR